MRVHNINSIEDHERLIAEIEALPKDVKERVATELEAASEEIKPSKAVTGMKATPKK